MQRHIKPVHEELPLIAAKFDSGRSVLVMRRLINWITTHKEVVFVVNLTL